MASRHRSDARPARPPATVCSRHRQLPRPAKSRGRCAVAVSGTGPWLRPRRTRLPASGEIDARSGGELVEARGLAIVLRKAATALFPKDPEIALSVSVALVGGEFVEPHEALSASAAADTKPARGPPPGRALGDAGTLAQLYANLTGDAASLGLADVRRRSTR